MSVLAQAGCNYTTEGSSRLINTLTGCSRPTRVNSAAGRRSDNSLPICQTGSARAPAHAFECVECLWGPDGQRRRAELSMARPLCHVTSSTCHQAGGSAKAAPYIPVGSRQVVGLRARAGEAALGSFRSQLNTDAELVPHPPNNGTITTVQLYTDVSRRVEGNKTDAATLL